MSNNVAINGKIEGAGGGCFPGYACVDTKRGPIPIESILPGDLLVSFDEKGELHEAVVKSKIVHPAEEVLRIYYWGGSIDVTGNHWMLNQYNTFALASSFTSDDAFIDKNGHLRPILKMESIGQYEVYNLGVDTYHNFICEGIRVHNGGRGAGRYADYVEGAGGGGGGKGGGGTSYTPTEAPNTLSSNTVARVLDVISEGVIDGLVDGSKSIFFNDTPLQNSDDTFNFTGVTISTREGLPGQDFIAGFPATETEVGVGVEVLVDTPVVRTITDTNATAVAVKIRIPRLTKQSTNGDLNGSSVSFDIELQSDGGGFVQVRSETVSGKTTSPYEVSYRIDLPEGGSPWDIKVVRISADSSDDATLANSTFWSTYTKIIDNKLSYDDTALVGVEIDAKQFAEQVPSRAYEVKGLQIKIPSNYDPITRVYTGLWDGSFVTAWTDNPAWVLYDLITNKRYGLGESITASQVDKFALFEIAQHCDGLVPDGQGGMEPRYTFNGIINTREQAFKVLNSVVSNFRGMLYWSSGLVTAVADKDEDPAKLITPANTIDGRIDYTGPSLKTLHSVALVRWNDPEDGYKSSIVAVEDPELIAKLGWKPKDVVAYGCTSKGQAFRVGEWFLDTEKNAKEVAIYRASFDHADVTPGQIIAIADPSFAGIRFGGRIVQSTLSSVTVDLAVKLSTGESYTILAHLPDGSVEERTVTNPSDDADHVIISVTPDFSLAPTSGSMWLVSGTDAAPRKFRVVAISEDEKNIYSVSCVIHDPTKYDRVELGINTEEGSFSVLPTGPLPPPTDLSTEEYLYRASNGVVQGAVSVSWTAPSDPRFSFYQVQVMRPDTDFWEGLDNPILPNIDVLNISPGQYKFRVRVVDPFGLKSEYVTESFILSGLLEPPSDVTTFRVSNIGGQSSLTWEPVSDLDLSHYTIKFSSKTSDARWEAATVLVERVPPSSGNHVVPTLIGTYLIKAVDTSGKESVNAGFIVSNIGDITQDNVVVTIQEDPSFEGIRTNVSASGGALQLVDLGQEGVYRFNKGLDLGAVFTSRVIPFMTAVGSDSSNTMDTWLTLDSVAFMTNTNPGDWSTSLGVRVTDDPPWYSDSNIITKPIDIDDVFWVKQQVVISANSTNAPDGNTVADTITEDSSLASAHYVYSDLSQAPDLEEVWSVWLKSDGTDYVKLSILDADSLSNFVEAVFNINTGVVESVSSGGDGTGEVATIIDAGAGWYRCIITGVPNSTGTNTRVSIELGQDATTFTYDGDGSSGVSAWGAELIGGSVPNTPVWTPFEEIIIGDYTTRAFDFELSMLSLNNNTTPLVSDLAVTIDMPDRVERGEDVSTDGSGVGVITYTSEFKEKPALNVTAQDMLTGDTWTIDPSDTTGFTVTFKNSSGVGVQRTFDWTASGFGRRQ